MTRSALYRGSLVHTRRDHLRRTFRYPVFMAAIDLDEVTALDRELRLFSLDRPNLFSLYARDFSTPLAPRSIATTRSAATTAPIAAAESITAGDESRAPSAHTPTSTTLVTNLRFAGYTFNPVSFFLRYAGDSLVGVTAEVNNTYGGRHCYELDDSNRVWDVRPVRHAWHATLQSPASSRPGSTIANLNLGRVEATRVARVLPADSEGVRVAFRTTRELFVSPFLHGPRVYEWWFPARRDPERLAITMHVDTPDGERVFTATLAGERRTMSDPAMLRAAVRYPWNTAQVIGLIHLEAMKLRYLHGEPYRRPGPDHRPLDM